MVVQGITGCWSLSNREVAFNLTKQKKIDLTLEGVSAIEVLNFFMNKGYADCYNGV